MTHDLNTLIIDPRPPLAHRILAPQPGLLGVAPCLLLLHGVGANELGMADIAAQLDPQLAIILVCSPFQLGPMQFGFFQVSFTRSGPVIDAGQAEQSCQLSATFIRELPGVYGIDAKQIWIAGFSQGGILSASLGLTCPGLVKGIGILSGRILPEIGPQIAPRQQLAGLHAFISHGVSDSKLTVEFARSAQKLLSEKGVVPTYREYSAGHEIDQAMLRDFNQWMSQQLDNVSTSK